MGRNVAWRFSVIALVSFLTAAVIPTVTASPALGPSVPGPSVPGPGVPGAATKISGPLPVVWGASVGWDFEFTPDGKRVVFRGGDHFYSEGEHEPIAHDHFALYSVPVDGGPRVRLAPPGGPRRSVYDFAISPDSSRVVFRAIASGVPHLFSVPVTGGPVVRLSDLADEYVSKFYEITPDATQVVYLAGGDLYSAPIVGGGVVKLNQGARVDNDFAVSPDSQRVVYEAGALNSVRLTGTDRIRLDDGGGNPLISPDSSWVVYESYRRLRSVPITGGPVSTISHLPSKKGVIYEFVFTPDSTRVVFRSNVVNVRKTQLYSVPTGGGEIVRINAPLVAGGVGRFVVLDSSRVVYGADQDGDRQKDLYLAPILGTAAPVNVTNTPTRGVGPWEVTPDQSRVVYVIRSLGGDYALRSVPLDGGPVVDLFGPTSSYIDRLVVSADSQRAVFRAGNQRELHSVPPGGGDPILLSRSSIHATGWIEFHISPDATTVVYRWDELTAYRFELFSVDIAWYCKGEPATLVGTIGADTIDGTPQRDVIQGRAGDDTINGMAGHDLICGGPGRDTLRGGSGTDVMFGQAGGDLLIGQVGNDTLAGGSGNDELRGNNGNDTVYGDAGGDGLWGGPGDDNLDGGDDTDTLRGGDGTDTCVNGESYVSCELPQ